MAQHFTNVGFNILLDLLKTHKTLFIGIGNSAAGIDPTFTGLQGDQFVRVPMVATYPQVIGTKIVVKAEVPETEGNFAWREWGLFDAEIGGNMLFRIPEEKGTKPAGQLWVFESDIVLL